MTPSEELIQEFNSYQSVVKLEIREKNTFRAILKDDMFIDPEGHPVNVNKQFHKTIAELVKKYYAKNTRVIFNNTHTIFWISQE